MALARPALSRAGAAVCVLLIVRGMRVGRLGFCLAWVVACGGPPSDHDVDGGGVAVVDSSTPAPDAGTEPPTVRVLFIGNSYTGVNDLPHVVARLAEAPDSPVRFEVGQYTPGGQTWGGHDADPRVDALIAEGWDYVVLQDQSAQPFWDLPDVKAALLSLDAKIRATSARTVLFMTWAYEDGGLFQQMRVDSYYVRAAEATGALLAPVGRAWERARRDPSMTLHAEDGSHPNARGTYLAACVFYATLTGQSPLGLGDGGLGVTEEDAAALQRAAWDSIGARSRPAAPLLGRWSLSSASVADDLVPAGELVLGDAAGPDGTPSSATRFTPTAYLGVPYFEGLDRPELTVSFAVHRADWSAPTEHREYLVSRSGIYSIYLEGTALAASVETTVASDQDLPPLPPVPPEPPPPSTIVTYPFDELSPGWHRIALTHDGITERLWIDGENVASAPLDAAPVCAAPGPGCDAGIVVGVDGDIVSVHSSVPPQLAFTGELADLQVHAVALDAEQIRGL